MPALLLLCLLTSALAAAQAPPDTLIDCAALRRTVGSVRYADTMPEYRAGGSAGLVRFIGATVDRKLRRRGAGKVFVSFVVTAAGAVRCPEVTRGLGPPYDAEALRVARQFGAFVPATKDGRAVPCWFTVPITFGR